MTSTEIKISKNLENGIKFSCQMCGDCCRGFKQGEVYLYKDDILKLAKSLHMTGIKGLRDCYLLGFSGCEFLNSSRSLRFRLRQNFGETSRSVPTPSGRGPGFLNSLMYSFLHWRAQKVILNGQTNPCQWITSSPEGRPYPWSQSRQGVNS